MQAVDPSRKLCELPQDHLEIVRENDVDLHPTDSAEDFCGLQLRSAVY